MSGLQTTSFPEAAIGILLVKTQFRRYLGDIGNQSTWPFPVIYQVVDAATPDKMGQLDSQDLLQPFKQAAEQLIARGAIGLTTSCGFLSYYQQELAAWSPVPIVTSSLLQYATISRMLPAGKKPLILTFNGAALKGDYLKKVGIPEDAYVVGLPQDSVFVQSILGNETEGEWTQLEQEVLLTAKNALERYPDTGALLLECTNISPFSASLRRQFGLPVFDIVTLVNTFSLSLNPPVYDGGINWCY